MVDSCFGVGFVEDGAAQEVAEIFDSMVALAGVVVGDVRRRGL
ncbi:hypothetical protein [Nocardia sp. CA-290969]